MISVPPATDPPPRVLISDFDGTMTERDFYQLVIQHHLPPTAPDYWQQYRDGKLTHFEALASIFAYVPIGEEGLIRLTEEMQLEPELPAAVAKLEQAGWRIIVLSAGCRWYIDRLLREANVSLEVHANPGVVDDLGHLQMLHSFDDPFRNHEVGIDKPGLVKAYVEAGHTVAFAGDGPPDLPAALLVPPDLRFARGTLVELLKERNESFRPYQRWRDIAEALAAESANT